MPPQKKGEEAHRPQTRTLRHSYGWLARHRRRQQQKRKDNQGPLLLVLIFSTLLYQGIVYLTTNSSIFSIEGRKMVLME